MELEEITQRGVWLMELEEKTHTNLYEYSPDQIEFLANIVRDHIDLSRYRALSANEIKAARGALVRIVEQAKKRTDG